MSKALVSVKCTADIPKEVQDHVVFDRVDNNVVAVTFNVGGKFLRVEKGVSYSDALKILVEEPPKFQDKFVLQGVYAGIPVKLEFDEEYDATNKLNELKATEPYSATPDEYNLEITKIAVEVQSNF